MVKQALSQRQTVSIISSVNYLYRIKALFLYLPCATKGKLFPNKSLLNLNCFRF